MQLPAMTNIPPRASLDIDTAAEAAPSPAEGE
jgi:hypothetical protein